MAKLSFKGFDKIEKMLNGEINRINSATAYRVLRAGADVAVAEMVNNIKKGPHSEHLKDSIGIFDMKYTKMDGYTMGIGPCGYREEDNEPFPKIAFALEYGTSKVKPHPWMRPAIKKAHDDIEEAMIKELMK